MLTFLIFCPGDRLFDCYYGKFFWIVHSCHQDRHPQSNQTLSYKRYCPQQLLHHYNLMLIKSYILLKRFCKFSTLYVSYCYTMIHFQANENCFVLFWNTQGALRWATLMKALFKDENLLLVDLWANYREALIISVFVFDRRAFPLI